MTALTFYGGVGEIGGNKILLEDNGTKIMLDFGRRMGEAGKYYEEFIQIRSKSALLDLLKLGILPKINGLYSRSFLDYTSLANDGTDLTKLPLDEAEDYWRNTSIEPYSKKDSDIDGVFISHAHFDHIQDVSFIDKGIDIYSTETTKVLSKAITDVSNSGVEYQFYEVKDKLKLVNKTESYKTVFPNELEFKEILENADKKCNITCPKSGYVFTKDVVTSIRNYKTKPTGKIGNLSYKIVPVGHSVPGAASILLTTSDNKRILYTGDIRFHGKDEPSMEECLAGLGKEPIDVMICEGTRVDSDKKLTEEDVFQNIKKKIQEVTGLIFIDFGWKDTTRFETIAQAALEAGRIFLINPKIAYLLYELHRMDGSKYKNPIDMKNVKVYKKRQEGCLYSKNDYAKFKAGYLDNWGRNKAKEDKNLVRIAEKKGVGREASEIVEDLSAEENLAWNLATSHIDNGVTAYEVRKDPEKYVLMFSFWDANELFDISTPEGKIQNSLYIRASCEPFSDEMEIDERKLMNWLEKFGIDYDHSIDEKGNKHFISAHVSGHASGLELVELIETIMPKRLFPIHTEKPGLFKKLLKGTGIEVVEPKVGKPYSL